MASGKFAQIHLHTPFSLNDSLNHLGPLIKRGKELGLHAMAITDHGNLFGMSAFIKACKKEGMKYIIGAEAYIDPRGMDASTFKERGITGRDNRHLVLLVKNEIGYKNLITLMSKASLYGMYYDPRIDHELLSQHSEGLIALSACLGGDVAKEIEAAMNDESLPANDGYAAGLKRALWYKELFGEDFYLEIQDNAIEAQYVLNAKLIRMSKETGIKLVATNDSHYITRDQYKYHDAYMALGSQTHIYDLKRKKYASDEFYLKGYQDMAATGNIPLEAIENTADVADKCTFELKTGVYHIPIFPKVPDGETHEAYLERLAFEGLERRRGFKRQELGEEQYRIQYIDRLHYELESVRTMGFNDYFLIVWDFAAYAFKMGFLPGPGRGSAAGSLLAYSLDITHLDPIEEDLIFERFLNISRISMPDIDYDIDDINRQSLIRYVEDLYGKENVGQIITFNNKLAKGAIKAAGRALNIPYEVAESVAKMVPKVLNITIEEAMQANPSMKTEYDTNAISRELINTALAFEGLPSNPGTHAAGVVIAPFPLMGNMPLWVNRSKANKKLSTVVAQMEMGALEANGYLKMDFLGLTALSICGMAIRDIEKNHGIVIDYKKLLEGGYDSPDVYAIMGKGDTEGIFQLEGKGMTDTAIAMNVATFKEVTALVALYRPGPMAYIPTYIENKANPSRIKYPFAELAPILAETYGVLVFQEQVMTMVQAIAGYSMADADSMRKAIGKKDEKLIQMHRTLFVYGKNENGEQVIAGGIAKYPAKALEKYYDETIVPFGKYAFNKSHAASYARVAAMHAYLKRFFPVEFMAARIDALYRSNLTPDKLEYAQNRYFAYCKAMGIPINPPNILHSSDRFVATKEGSIMFSLSAIKGVGSAAGLLTAEQIQNGPFKDAAGFLGRAAQMPGVSKGAVEALIMAGATDSLGSKRSEILAVIEDYFDAFKRYTAKLKTKNPPKGYEYYPLSYFPKLLEFPNETLLRNEKIYAGTYFSGHPLDAFMRDIRIKNSILFCDLVGLDEDGDASTGDDDDETFAAPSKPDLSRFHGQRYDGISMITGITEVVTKKNAQLMGFMTLSDGTGSFRAVLYNRTYLEYKDKIKSGQVVSVSGKFNLWNDELSLIPERILPCAIKELPRAVEIVSEASHLRDILQALSKRSGDYPITISNGKISVMLPKKAWATHQEAQSLMAMFGGHISERGKS